MTFQKFVKMSCRKVKKKENKNRGKNSKQISWVYWMNIVLTWFTSSSQCQTGRDTVLLTFYLLSGVVLTGVPLQTVAKQLCRRWRTQPSFDFLKFQLPMTRRKTNQKTASNFPLKLSNIDANDKLKKSYHADYFLYIYIYIQTKTSEVDNSYLDYKGSESWTDEKEVAFLFEQGFIRTTYCI